MRLRTPTHNLAALNKTNLALLNSPHLHSLLTAKHKWVAQAAALLMAVTWQKTCLYSADDGFLIIYKSYWQATCHQLTYAEFINYSIDDQTTLASLHTLCTFFQVWASIMELSVVFIQQNFNVIQRCKTYGNDVIINW